ncbi:MAG: response regulator [Candidatus Moduliflexus flocculans]|nr:response regulator [Candidatus Moduliflexus flocculans]
MDIRLQGSLDGVETAAQLNDRWSVPVILLTAYADETTLARAKITQPFGYLLKPFDERELRTSIEIALYRSMMEKRLRESERLLHQAQKMEAVGRLAGGIAHDFNNILTAILGYANLLGRRPRRIPGLLEDVEGVKKAVKRAEALTRQLLAFSRRQPMEPRVINPGEALDEMERMMGRLLPAGVHLIMRSGDKAPLIRIDPIHFEQIVLNLIVNARDAMPGGGEIEVRLSACDLEESRTGALERIPAGSYASLTVRDLGVGIPPEDYDRIFEPFFTTKAKEGGTGLGLATVYGIVKQSNGYIDLESRVGNEDQVFSASLGCGTAPSGNPRGSRKPGTPGGRRRSWWWRTMTRSGSLMERALARRGYTVLAAAHPGEAILVSERLAEGPDLIVADIGLPIMSGLDLVKRLRRARPGLKALFVSGYPERAPEAEDSSFLPKPFTEAVLAAAVRRLLDSPVAGS